MQQCDLLFDDINQIEEFMYLIFHNFKQAVREENVRGVFMIAGFSFNIDAVPTLWYLMKEN
jgi:hypothetical protein